MPVCAASAEGLVEGWSEEAQEADTGGLGSKEYSVNRAGPAMSRWRYIGFIPIQSAMGMNKFRG